MPTLAEAVFQKFVDVNSDVDGEFIIVAPKVDVQQGIPQVLVISSRNVDTAGDPDELNKLLSNVLELDLSHNMLKDLTEIGLIFQHAPKLRFLNLGFNNLSVAEIPTNPSEFASAETLKTLILLGTQATWNAIRFLLNHAKNVTELHLSLNQYTQVDLQSLVIENAHSQIEKLMFDSNPVSSWEEISKLGSAFPQLSHMSLTDCPIDSIPRNGGENFKNLKTMWLSNTRISKLDDFENLKHFAKLNDLRVNGIPFLQDFNEEARRQHFIALLPNVVTLNRGRAITEDDRVTAERNFIRHYLDHDNPPARYHELKQVYGEVHKLVDIDFKLPNKAKLLIRFEDKEMCRVDVNLKKTVKELKDFLEPIIGLSASNMDLFYCDPVDSYVGSEFMRFPTKQLYTYRMKDNDEIFVHKKGTVVCGSTTIYTK